MNTVTVEAKLFTFTQSYVKDNSDSLKQPHNINVRIALQAYLTSPNGSERRPGIERRRLAQRAAQALIDHNWSNVNNPIVAEIRG